MGDFRSFKHAIRQPARAMQPIVAPTAWTPQDLRDVASWSYRLSEQDRAELIEATEAVKGIALEEVGRANFRLFELGKIVADVRRELLEGRGIVTLQNFPVERLDRARQAIAYLGMGAHLGNRISQNRQGHILGHVKDLGGDYSKPNTRGYMTRAEMRFHSDSCDYVGLLCLNTARSGGESLVTSSVTVYNTMLERRPDLVKVLTEDFYRSRMGEAAPGQEPWYRMPIFSFDEGDFYSVGGGIRLEHAYSLPGVPPMSAAQKEALELYKNTIRECAAEIPFVPGDVQFLNNYVTMHTRRAYEDWPEPSRKRHLLRLWLSDPASHPKGLREESFRSGIAPAPGAKLHAPLDATEASLVS
jgi:TfdA family taurine catabolism dioxygenase TauD